VIRLSQNHVLPSGGYQTETLDRSGMFSIGLVAAGDLTGDGLDDIVVSGEGADGPRTVLLSATPTVP
jgi:hypothetical protein